MEVTDITPNAYYLAPLPYDISLKYSHLIKKSTGRVKVADKLQSGQDLIKVMYEDFGREEIISRNSLIPINQGIENIPLAIETMYLSLEETSKLADLDGKGRKMLSEILWSLTKSGGLKATLVKNSKLKKTVNQNNNNNKISDILCISMGSHLKHP